MSIKYNSVRIHFDGTVEWIPGSLYMIMCNMDTTLFPFDIQTCHFEFENWAYRVKCPGYNSFDARGEMGNIHKEQ